MSVSWALCRLPSSLGVAPPAKLFPLARVFRSLTRVRVGVCCAPLLPLFPAGVLIYFGYGMWNSTLEITARENEVHASTYQRYDQGVDEGFCGFDDDFYPPTSDAWGGGVDGAPPSAEEGQTVGKGAPSAGGDRTVAKHALAEEDPMDF